MQIHGIALNVPSPGDILFGLGARNDRSRPLSSAACFTISQAIPIVFSLDDEAGARHIALAHLAIAGSKALTVLDDFDLVIAPSITETPITTSRGVDRTSSANELYACVGLFVNTLTCHVSFPTTVEADTWLFGLRLMTRMN